jgi:allantoicase
MDAAPDGGVARLRVHGEVIPDPRRLGGRLDLAASLTDIGTELLPRTRLQPDTEHYLRLTPAAPVIEARLDIYPDGGISRLRLNGSIPPGQRRSVANRWERLLPPSQLGTVDICEYFA